MSRPEPSEAPSVWRSSFRALNATQFLGAFNDNVFKYVIVLLAAGTSEIAVADAGGFDLGGMTPEALAGGIFALPFVLLGGFSGSLADRFPKPRLIRVLKFTELAVMVAGTVAFLAGSPEAMLFVLLLMGTQSAFFGPAKYGVLPEMLPPDRLPGGNAVVLATTYGAIIGGTFVGGELLELLGDGYWVVGVVCCVVSALGILTSLRVDPLPAAAPGRRLPRSPFGSFFSDMADASRDRELLVCMLLGALFLHVGSLVTFAMFDYAPLLLGKSAAGPSRLAGVLTIGIGVGAMGAGRLCRGRIETGMVPLGAVGVAAAVAGLGIPFEHWGWAVALLIGAGLGAGLYLVPVRSLLQQRPAAQVKGRYMGASQILDFSALVLSAGVYHGLKATLDLSPRERMVVIGAISAVGSAVLFSLSRLYVQRTLPWLRDPSS